MQPATNSAFVTISDVAAELDIPHSKAEYLARRKGLRPVARAGNVKLYAPECLTTFREALHNLRPRRTQQQALAERPLVAEVRALAAAIGELVIVLRSSRNI